MSPVKAITVTVTGVANPKDTDAVALLVPYDANRSVIPPQKFQWLIKGSAGTGYLKTGASTLTCGPRDKCKGSAMQICGFHCGATIVLAAT